jgi:hypothetical protein
MATKKKRVIGSFQVHGSKEVSNDDVKNNSDSVLDGDVDELKQRQVSQQK